MTKFVFISIIAWHDVGEFQFKCCHKNNFNITNFLSAVTINVEIQTPDN